MSQNTAYFQLLSRDTLQNVARFLSTEPNSEQWREHIDAHALGFVFSSGSGLQSCAPDVTAKTLCIDDDVADAELVSNMAAVAGRSFTALELEGIQFRNWRRVRDLVARTCVNVKQLTLNMSGWNSVVLQLFEQQGHRFEVVKLRLFPVADRELRKLMNAMAKHCTAIKEISFRVQHLKETDLIWKHCGHTLEAVTIQPFPSTYLPLTLDNIKTHCRMLKSVRITTFFGKPPLMSSVASLLISLAHQLKFAFLGDMSVPLCTQVANACKNARFAVKDYNNTALQIASLDGRLQDLEVLGSKRQSVEDVRLSRGALYYLETLNINCKACDDEFLQLVLNDEKPNLHTVQMFYFSYVSTRILETLGSMARNLRKLEISEACLKVGMFRQFALLSSVSLEHVGIEGFMSDAQKGDEIVVDIVESFSICKKLRYLEIGQVGRRHQHEKEELSYLYESGIATACLPLRRRRVHTKIGNVVL